MTAIMMNCYGLATTETVKSAVTEKSVINSKFFAPKKNW